MNSVAFLLGNFCDLVIGEPNNPLHPVRLIGRVASWLESMISIKSQKTRGFIVWVLTMSITLLITQACLYLLANISYGTFLFEVIIIYFCISSKGLLQCGNEVINLVNTDLHQARKSLSMIVGRDVETLNKTQIIKAVIETVSENISDGIIAPMFYYLCFGIQGMLLYKAVNTMDSMFGYKNEKYCEFGYFPAKLDDLFNLIPARLSSLLMILACPLVSLSMRDCFRITKRDRYNHLSPNSAHPESSAAGALGIQLGGASTYGGILVDKPTIGDAKNEINEQAYQSMKKLLIATTLLMILLVIGGKIYL